MPIPDIEDLPAGPALDLDELAACFLGRPLLGNSTPSATGPTGTSAVTIVDSRVELGEALRSHHLTRAIVESAGDRPRAWHDVIERIVGRVPNWGRVHRRAPERVSDAVAKYLALLSVARVGSDRGPVPLFSIQVQLWVREVSRLLRAGTSEPAFRWNDRASAAHDAGVGPDGSADGHGRTDLDSANSPPDMICLPAVYCRHCGRTGWASVISESDGSLVVAPAAAYKASIERSPRFRVLLRAEPAEVDAQWFDPRDRRTTTVVPRSSPHASWVCVLVTPDNDDAKRDECPSCGAGDAIRFLGSQVASLASVTLGQMFGSAYVDVAERKLLAFTDSVQDASHRASFFGARTYRFNLQALLSRVIQDHDGMIDLGSLGSLLLTTARDRGADVVFGLVPPRSGGPSDGEDSVDRTSIGTRRGAVVTKTVVRGGPGVRLAESSRADVGTHPFRGGRGPDRPSRRSRRPGAGRDRDRHRPIALRRRHRRWGGPRRNEPR